MNEVALVTANFGGIDELKALPDHDGVDAFYYTDEEARRRADSQALASWTRVIVPDYPRHDFVPRLRARYFKHQIHRLDEVQDHRWLVWADSSLQFSETQFILEQVDRLASLSPRQRIMVVPHPDRGTVREEYQFIKDAMANGNEYLRKRYEREKMTEQISHFQRRGWNIDASLWCGTFWIVENSDVFKRLWNDWWDQNLRFGLMDQLSLPVILEQYHCVPQRLDIHLYRNEYFVKIQHTRDM